MLDTIIVFLILCCSIYECYILTKEFKYDEKKDLDKAQKKTRTTKKVTTNPGGTTTTEETNETSEPVK